MSNMFNQESDHFEEGGCFLLCFENCIKQPLNNRELQGGGWCGFENIGEGDGMNYVLLCIKCKRPAELNKEKSKPGSKVYKSTCECGGKIKPMLD